MFVVKKKCKNKYYYSIAKAERSSKNKVNHRVLFYVGTKKVLKQLQKSINKAIARAEGDDDAL